MHFWSVKGRQTSIEVPRASKSVLLTEEKQQHRRTACWQDARPQLLSGKWLASHPGVKSGRPLACWTPGRYNSQSKLGRVVPGHSKSLPPSHQDQQQVARTAGHLVHMAKSCTRRLWQQAAATLAIKRSVLPLQVCQLPALWNCTMKEQMIPQYRHCIKCMPSSSEAFFSLFPVVIVSREFSME